MSHDSVSELLAAAQGYLAAARYVEAELACRAVLQRHPDEPDAYRLLALVAHFAGLPSQALPLLQRAIHLDPSSGYAYDNLSAVLLSLGRRSDAEAASRRAVALRPDDARFWCNLAVALEAQAQLAEAEECYRRAIRLEPELFEAARNLGRLLIDGGRPEEASEICRIAVALNSQSAAAHANLGAALAHQGRRDEAARCFRRALELDPQQYVAIGGYAELLLDAGQGDTAESLLRQALIARPGESRLSFLLGKALHQQARFEDAEDGFRRVLAAGAPAAETLSALAQSLLAQGRVAEAAETCRQALALAPTAADIHSQLLYIEQFRPEATAAGRAALHAQWQARHAPPDGPVWRDDGRSRDSDRALRLGFVSAEFTQHPLGRLMAALAEQLGQRHAVYCYHQRSGRDAVAAQIEKAAAGFREAALWSDERLYDQIRRDAVDVLFDLGGHAPAGRAPVFARKPAPLQVAWLGDFGTTGLAAMDYLLADAWHAPLDAEAPYCERVLRMPDDCFCYTPPPDAPEVSALPAGEKGCVTLGCFNPLAKLSDACLVRFAAILARVPGSRLLLKCAGADGPRVRQRLTAVFAAAGIESSRVEFSGGGRHPLFLRHYQQVDVALDPFPCSDGLSSCDALWMGVPVVTLPGDAFASRHAFSHLSCLGLTETIARNPEHYVELAASWALDLGRLAECRGDLRAAMAASALCDVGRFAAHFEHLIRAVWRGWAGSNAPPPVVEASL